MNYLCLPNDPENGPHQSYSNDQVYGSEYKLSSSSKPSGWSESMYKQEVPCAVCYQQRRSAVLMIPGTLTSCNLPEIMNNQSFIYKNLHNL